MFKKIKSLLKKTGGNVAVAFAVSAAPLLGAAGLAMDYAVMFEKKSNLQQAADIAALAAAKELAVATTKSSSVQSIAEAHVYPNVQAPDSDVKVAANLEADSKTVNVDLSLYWKPFFAQYFDKRVLPIKVTARATLAGGSSTVCVLALDPAGSSAISMEQSAAIKAKKCAVYANSKSSSGISVSSKSSLSAKDILVSGGYAGPVTSYNPKPVTDSPPIPDPLAGRAQPTVGGCDFNNFFINDGNATLNPGVYCGGISVKGKSAITLTKGVYIIKDGLLNIQGNSTIKGDGVGFFFSGTNAGFDFGVSTQVVLSAPGSGPLSGILFFQGRGSGIGAGFTIRSKDAEKFEGTVYIPNGTFIIDKASRVGQKSNWTAIIAHRILIGNGPSVEIKSDYNRAGATPVPQGIITGGKVRLIN